MTNLADSPSMISPDLNPVRPGSNIVKPIEAICAALVTLIVALLLIGVVSRYVFSNPVIWIDEVASIAFLWVAMLGSVLAVDRNEHLRLNLFVEMMPKRLGRFVHTFALLVVASFLLFMLHPSMEYVKSEWVIRTPALDLPNGFRVSAIGMSLALMLALVLRHAYATSSKTDLVLATGLTGLIGGVCWLLSPTLQTLGTGNIPIFLVGFVAVCLVCGVRCADCVLFWHRHAVLFGLWHHPSAGSHHQPHGRGHEQPGAGIGADFCAVGLCAGRHRHGQGHH